VSQLSYGRQLGKITDALATLIERTSPDGKAPYQKFFDMKSEIDRIKNSGSAARIEQLKSDLERLRASDPKEFELISEALRRIV
jgi:hypothetical protein